MPHQNERGRAALQTRGEQKDSRAIEPRNLSRKELEIIFGIEGRILEDKYKPYVKPAGVKTYLARVEDRYPRVLLLDGGRGTGKTSILLTLVERWHHHLLKDNGGDLKAEYDEHVSKLNGAGGQFVLPQEYDLPSNICVLPILDFDPLPLEMPLMAAIMEAWRPLAGEYDNLSTDPQYYQSSEGPTSLVDRWHRLFHTAAAGWGTVSPERGLLEQVLDREEQVENWQRLADDWKEFVSKVLEVGRRAVGKAQIDETTIFVIMIDDCDLQVERIRHLLPALRMLNHPQVFFLVAADKEHMLQMLAYDFFGQQQQLAKHRITAETPLHILSKEDAWARQLAESSFEKVFPTSHQWRLDPLLLAEVLNFPAYSEAENGKLPSAANFGSLLNHLPNRSRPPKNGHSSKPTSAGDLRQVRSVERDEENAGELLRRFSTTSNGVLPGTLTYRSAEQLSRRVALLLSQPERVAALVASRLISGWGGESDAVVRSAGLQSLTPTSLGSSKLSPVVDYLVTGELSAVYRPSLIVGGGAFDVHLSTRPDFAFIDRGGTVTRMSEAPRRFNFEGALVAKILDLAGFPVDTASLGWTTYVSHVWTEWTVSGKTLPFAWNRQEHPRPDALFLHNGEWAEFLSRLRSVDEPNDENTLIACAYAWLVLQRRWTSKDTSKWPSELANAGALITGITSTNWKEVLRPLSAARKVRGRRSLRQENEERRWQKLTLPLLARPEIGLPPRIQRMLLDQANIHTNEIQELRDQRQRLVTDAIHAGLVLRGTGEFGSVTNAEVEAMIAEIDRTYRDAYGSNYWYTRIERPARTTKASASKPR